MLETGDVTLNPEERQKVKLMLVEMTKCLRRIDDERDMMKDIASACEEEFGIKKKLVNKLARTMYKHDYADIQQENNHFEYLYETLIEGRKED